MAKAHATGKPPANPGNLTQWLRTAGPREVFDMARKMEAGAIRDYTRLARAASSAVTRAKFRYMIEEERRHKRFLDLLCRGLPKGRPLPRTGLSEVAVTPDETDIVRAVEQSIENEKRAAAFYAGAAKRCKGAPARKVLRGLASMEKEHARLLRDELRALRGDWGWSSLEGAVPDEEDFWETRPPPAHGKP
jgi:rubrerythrin